MIWWLSFCDPKKPPGSQFLGVCLVEGSDVVTAALEAHLQKVNPGGEVAGVEIAPQVQALVPKRWMNRLLTREEGAAFDKEVWALRKAASS